MKTKLPIKTDWVTIKEAVKILENMGVERGRTTLYSHARTGKIKAREIPQGKSKRRYLIYVPALEKYAKGILHKESSGRN